MKNKLVFLTLAMLANACITIAAPLGTAFTYQGRLEWNGQPATGEFLMRFALYDAPAPGGNLVTGTNLQPVGVTNGLFTIDLDFGASVFAGEARWLDVAVSTNNGATYTTLLPRTRVAPTPNSLYASTAGTAMSVANGSVVKSLNGLQDTVSLVAGPNIALTPSGNSLTIASTAGPGIWSVNGSNAYYNGGSVGIGTSTPSALLHVNSSATASSVLGAFLQPSLLPDGFARIYLGRTPTANGCATFTYNFDAFTPSDSFLSLGLYNSSFSLNISGDGNVGIGTIYPQSKLHVAGNILCGGSVAANVVKVGSSAELFAPGGEENLRIIRGTVLANGSRLSGSGFTVTRIGIGQYSVSFDVEFPTAATITATFSSRGTTDGRFIRVTENYPTSKLYIFDVLAMNGVPTDDAFNFIAIGPR